MFVPPVSTVFGDVEFGVVSGAPTVVAVSEFKRLGSLGTSKGLVEDEGALPKCNALTYDKKQPLDETYTCWN